MSGNARFTAASAAYGEAIAALASDAPDGDAVLAALTSAGAALEGAVIATPEDLAAATEADRLRGIAIALAVEHRAKAMTARDAPLPDHRRILAYAQTQDADEARFVDERQ
jgi:hypothetical protein